MTIRASQVVLEVLVQADPTMRAGQSVLEVLLTGLNRRASQSLLEVLLTGLNRRSGQQLAEILVWNHRVLMPDLYPTLPGLAYSVIKRPKFFTGIGTSAVGREVRVAYAVNPLWEFDLTYNYLPDVLTASSATASDFKTLIGFYLAHSGAFQGFAFEDPDDHTVTAQPLGTTDGTTTNWTFARSFGGGSGQIIEPIGWLNTSAPINVYLAGTIVSPSLYTLLTTQGCLQQVKFTTAPTTGQAISADFSYRFSVRFKEDHYDFEKFMDKLWSLASVTLMSQRD